MAGHLEATRTVLDRRTVLVGVEAEPENLVAVLWAAAEAHARATTLVLVHCVDFVPLVTQDSVENEELLGVMRRIGERLLTHRREQVLRRYPDLDVVAEVRQSSPVPVLTGGADGAAVVIVGTHRGRRASDLLAGSVSRPVAAHSDVPVVVVPPGLLHPGERHAVVVGVSGGPETPDVLAFAVAQAARSQLPLTVVHCWHADLLAVPPPGVAPQAQQLAELTVAEAVAGLRERMPTLQVHTVVAQAPPGEGLLAAAAGADLLVVGRHRWRPRAGMLLGSVSQRLIREAGCAVAVVPSPAID